MPAKILTTLLLAMLLSMAAYAQDAPPAAEPVTAVPSETGPGGLFTPDPPLVDEIRKDVILVLDNSGSMKNNDPEFLTSRAVREFIDGLDESTRLAIIIFDQDVELSLPLTTVSASTRDVILGNLNKIDYRGLFTDSPNAIERAIYELKSNGRADAQKLIIFMTDGIVDTGDTELDQEKRKWLRDSLAPDAADAGIKIFGIAFTESADFQLIQSLAQSTKGEYYRALQAQDLARVFDQININISTPPEPATPEPVAPAPPPVQTPAPPVIIEVPAVVPQSMSREERIRSIMIMSAAAVIIVSLLAILFMLVRRRTAGPVEPQVETEAYLNDIHGYTSQASYKLGTRPTMLGRVAGKESDQLDYIVIPESTIGRRHSLIEYKDFAYWIIDQGSINGTFVNDQPVTSEVRLKHGDKVRLHKYEFEFVMPEMVDAGMTVVSHTVMANRPAALAQTQQIPQPASDDATALKAGAAGAAAGMELDFDLTSGMGDEPDLDTGLDKDDELFADDAIPDDEDLFDLTAAPEDVELSPDDETYLPGVGDDDVITDDKPIARPTAPPPDDDLGSEDETLLPGDFELTDDEATIRKEDDDLSLDNFIDLDESDEDDK